MSKIIRAGEGIIFLDNVAYMNRVDKNKILIEMANGKCITLVSKSSDDILVDVTEFMKMEEKVFEIDNIMFLD